MKMMKFLLTFVFIYDKKVSQTHCQIVGVRCNNQAFLEVLWAPKVQQFGTSNWPEIKKPEKVVLQVDYEELGVWKIKQLISSMKKLWNMCFSYFCSCLIWKKANQISQNSNCGHVDMKITSTHLVTAVHCSQFHKRALSIFSKWHFSTKFSL